MDLFHSIIGISWQTQGLGLGIYYHQNLWHSNTSLFSTNIAITSIVGADPTMPPN